MAKAVLHLGSTEIIDTFAEAFRLRFARLVVTAHDTFWLDAGIQSFCGYATSVIGCDAEAGVERFISADKSPDGRPGASILAFGFTTDSLAEAVANRTGQCLLTCPTTAVFDGLSQSEDRIPLGQRIRFFGDGFEKTKVFEGRRYWRVPVMDGEFLVEETCGVAKGVGGGNLVIQGISLEAALASAKRAVSAIATVPGVITPFPGGVVRSGSKVGSRYAALKASSNDAFCPGLLGRVPTQLHSGVVACLEIVIDGENEQVICEAMAAAIQAAAGEGIPAISAGNYGGKLGKFRFYLHQILTDAGLS
ncbi:MAG: formylmethanofuran--tetrahydromethanopterin N-formyltransferase [Pirellulales bacterium]